MDLLVLEKLIKSAGVSGFEEEVAYLMESEFKKRKIEVKRDKLGNIIAKKGKGKRKIMLVAHMDEVGFIVKRITNNGFLEFTKIGGIDDRILLGKEVLVKGKKDCFGIIGTKPPHLQKEEERKNLIKSEEMFIDIGVKSKEEAEDLLTVGDPIVFYSSLGKLQENFYYGKAIDDRVGCFALLEIMEKINPKDIEVYAVATVQEEVGLKGARTATFKIEPDLALVFDTTLAGDTPLIKEQESNIKLNEGVCINLIEAGGRGLIVQKKLKDFFIEICKKNKIKYQLGVLEGGMTDGATIYISKEGISTGVLSIPTRYVHAPVSLFSLLDLERAINLGVKIISEFSEKKILF